MHEHTQKHSAKVQVSSDRSFGLVFAAVFLIVALYPLISGQSVRLWAIGVAGGFVLLALFIPKVLGPANRLWMKFGELLHKIVSPVALGIVFYLAVLPTGLLMRLLSKDPLRLRFDPAVSSYWILRDPPGPSADSLNNQF
jgi:hypothetical protein